MRVEGRAQDILPRQETQSHQGRRHTVDLPQVRRTKFKKLHFILSRLSLAIFLFIFYACNVCGVLPFRAFLLTSLE